jgi:hypothetical protein
MNRVPSATKGPGCRALAAGAGSRHGARSVAKAGSGAAAALLWLWAGAAQAIPNVSIGINSADWDAAEGVYRKRVDLNPSTWVDFSKDCPGVVGATSCIARDQPDPDESGILFSWGTFEFDTRQGDGRNSWLQVTFGAGVDFTLDTVAFKTVNTLPNLGPVAGPETPAVSPTQGTGTMLAYERNDPPSLFDVHRVTQQQMTIYANYRYDPNAGINTGDAVVDGWRVAADQDAPDDTDASLYGKGGRVADFQLEDSRKFFFTNSEVATVNDPSNPLADQNQTIQLQNGDSLDFQFYEEIWDNESLPGEGTPAPDAYYGAFDIVIKPLDAPGPALSVQNDANAEAGIDFGTVRAGDTSVERSLTARNSGDNNSALNNVEFADALGGAKASAFVPDPSVDVGPVNLNRDGSGVSQTLARIYSAAGLDFSDVAGVTIGVGEAVQSVSADGVTDITRDITATIKGPILGVSQDAAALASDPSAWLPYESVINLGSYEIGDPALISELVLANIFGAADADFTMLTFFNVDIEPISEGGDFAIKQDPTLDPDDELQAQEKYATTLKISFTASDPGLPFWTATLAFVTDQNSRFQVPNGTLGNTPFTFTLRVDNLAFAPAPSALALMAAGLLALGAARRRRA